MKKKLFAVILMMLMVSSVLSGCALFDSYLSSLKEDLIGNDYEMEFYDNFGNKTLHLHGDRISLEPVVLEEKYHTENGWEKKEAISSVIQILIDGEEMLSCGDTIIAYENGLTPDVDFKMKSEITSESNNTLGSAPIMSSTINDIKNDIGKPAVIVIKSQMGTPICAFSGESVYWEVAENLPKTTIFMVDGKRLYIHRTNFTVMNKETID